MPTKREIQILADRIKRLYLKRHRGRPGRRPDPEIFLGAAFFFLVNPERKRDKPVFTKKALSELDEFFSDGGTFESNEICRWLNSQGFKETIWENTWDSLRMGQKVYELIKKEGPIAPRDIQGRLNLSKARLDELPLLTASVRKTKERPKKFFVDQNFLSALRKLSSHPTSDKTVHQ